MQVVSRIAATGKPYIVSISGKTLEDNLEMIRIASEVFFSEKNMATVLMQPSLCYLNVTCDITTMHRMFISLRVPMTI